MAVAYRRTGIVALQANGIRIILFNEIEKNTKKINPPTLSTCYSWWGGGGLWTQRHNMKKYKAVDNITELNVTCIKTRWWSILYSFNADKNKKGWKKKKKKGLRKYIENQEEWKWLFWCLHIMWARSNYCFHQ